MISEKIECSVCGRLGFFRVDGDGRRMLHPYTEPCPLPPRPPVVKVSAAEVALARLRPPPRGA